MKIFKNDKNLPYKDTQIDEFKTKAEIDKLLSNWGIGDVFWEWHPEENNITVHFKLNEQFTERRISPTISLRCPTIWDKKGKRYNSTETINWKISLRILHWYIKNALAWSYASQSDKTVAFLPYVQVREGLTLKDVVKDNLDRIQALPALTEEKMRKVVTVEKQVGE